MRCPTCGARQPEEAIYRFCNKCGHALTTDEPAGAESAATTCTACGMDLPGGSRFCPACGIGQGLAGSPHSAGFADDGSAQADGIAPSRTAAPLRLNQVSVTCRCGTRVVADLPRCPACNKSITATKRIHAAVAAVKGLGLGKAERTAVLRDLRQEIMALPPTPGRTAAAIAILVLLFSTLMGAVAVSTAAPVTMRWVAPLVCPDGSKEAVIAVTERQTSKGTSMSSQMYCVDAAGFAVEVSDWVARPLVGLLVGLVVLALVLFRSLLRRGRNQSAGPKVHVRLGSR